MWEKLSDQIPAIGVTAALIIGASAFTVHSLGTRQEAALAPLREQNEALRVQADENRRDIEATTRMLKDAVAQHTGDGFRTDQEIQKLSDARIALLADTIAKKIEPALNPTPPAGDSERMQNEQIDRVASRLTDNLRPVLDAQKAESARQLQIAETQADQLGKHLAATQAAAQDALKLSHEISALYYDSFKDQGVLIRLMSLPANLVIDTAKGNLITSRDRTKAQQELSAKINEIEKRLREIQSGTSASDN
jgi:hypothetical protein